MDVVMIPATLAGGPRPTSECPLSSEPWNPRLQTR